MNRDEETRLWIKTHLRLIERPSAKEELIHLTASAFEEALRNYIENKY